MGQMKFIFSTQASPLLLKRNTLFRNFVLASNISLLGTNILDIAVPLYILEMTHSPVALAVVSIALNLPYFLMAPITGYCVDNLDKRRVMLFSDLGQVVCMLFLIFVDSTFSDSIWLICITVFVAKTLMTLFETVSTFQLIPALVESKDLAEANACFLTIYRLIQVVGPLLGGILLGMLGFRVCILINLASFGATLYFVFTLRNLTELIDGPNKSIATNPLSLRSISKEFSESTSYIWNSNLFKPFVLLMFLWNFSSLIPNTPSLIFYLKELQGFSSEEYGSMISIISFVGVVGFFWSHTLYKNFDFYTTFVGAALWQAALSTLAVIFFNHPVTLVIVLALSRVGSSILSMGTFLIRQTEIPKNKIGGVNACLRMLFMSSAPISALIQGQLLAHLGIGVSFAIGVICLWGSLWYAHIAGNSYQERLFTKKAA